MRKMILALILAIAAPVWATITLVHTASGNGNTLTISSTTAGNSVLLLVPFSTSPSTVVVGSQSAVKHPTCGYADGNGLLYLSLVCGQCYRRTDVGNSHGSCKCKHFGVRIFRHKH